MFSYHTDLEYLREYLQMMTPITNSPPIHIIIRDTLELYFNQWWQA